MLLRASPLEIQVLTVGHGGAAHGGILFDSRTPRHRRSQTDAGPTSPETAASVRERILELTEARPSLGGPIAMLAVGVVLAAGGVSVAAVGAEYLLIGNLSGFSLGTLGTVLLVIAVGIPLLIVGAITLRKNLRERRGIKHEMELLNQRLRELSEAGPSARDEAPRSTLVLASF